MQSENETFQTSQSDAIRHEIAQMRESVELTRSDIRRTKNEVEQHQHAHMSHIRRTRALWVIVSLLFAAAAGISWYGPIFLTEHRELLDRMPELRTALNDSDARINSTEQQISSLGTERTGFSERMSKIEKSVGSNLAALRNEARLMAQQIKYEAGQSLLALQNRVTGVESIQREHGEEVAQLRNDLAGVRRELASAQEENARQTNQLGQIQQAHQSTRNEVSGLDRRLSSNQTAVNTLNYQVERKRIDFEVQNGRTEQVVDGIYVTVKKTDVERQRVEGWVQIASEGRFVWLRGEGAQSPINFSSRSDARTYQLVFTRVGSDNAAGYVLVPMTNSATSATATN